MKYAICISSIHALNVELLKFTSQQELKFRSHLQRLNGEGAKALCFNVWSYI
jgi:hypothetical protein